jgi:hypothetical protein
MTKWVHFFPSDLMWHMTHVCPMLDQPKFSHQFNAIHQNFQPWHYRVHKVMYPIMLQKMEGKMILFNNLMLNTKQIIISFILGTIIDLSIDIVPTLKSIYTLVEPFF